MSLLPLRVDGKLIGTTPITMLIGMKVKISSFVDLATLDRWLAAMPVTEVSRQFQSGLCEFLKRHSSSISAAEAVEAAQREADRSKVIIVGTELESADHFRKDASLGASRLTPAAIDAVARAGRVDLFVRPPPVWDEEQAPLRKMTIDLHNYRPKLLQTLQRSNPEALTGPQMVQRYPDSPLVQRKMLPARVSVENGRVVTIPARPQRFAWE
jgi:hypothetical protein